MTGSLITYFFFNKYTQQLFRVFIFCLFLVPFSGISFLLIFQRFNSWLISCLSLWMTDNIPVNNGWCHDFLKSFFFFFLLNSIVLVSAAPLMNVHHDYRHETCNGNPEHCYLSRLTFTSMLMKKILNQSTEGNAHERFKAQKEGIELRRQGNCLSCFTMNIFWQNL